MQIALIPPIELLGEFMQESDMQLILPEPWMHSDAYRFYMDKYRLDYGQYRILDNGAAEAQPVEDGVLMRLIEQLRPDEFALPDVLGNAQATFDRGLAFLDKYSERIKASGVKVGLVAQGKRVEESLELVQRFVDATPTGLLRTIFIPRLLTKADGTTARLVVAANLVDWEQDFDLHLFGMSENWPGEAYAAGQQGYVRSIDSAMPFYYAKAGKRFPHVDAVVSSGPHRATYYMYQTYSKEELVLARENVETLRSCSGEVSGL